MDMKQSRRFLLALAALYWALVVMIYVVAGQQFHMTAVTTDALSAMSVIGEIADGTVVTQRLTAPADQLTALEIMAHTYGRVNTGTLNLRLTNGEGQEIARQSVDVSTFENGKYTVIHLEQTMPAVRGEALTLKMSTQGCAPGTAVTFYNGKHSMVQRARAGSASGSTAYARCPSIRCTG